MWLQAHNRQLFEIKRQKSIVKGTQESVTGLRRTNRVNRTRLLFSYITTAPLFPTIFAFHFRTLSALHKRYTRHCLQRKGR